MRQDNGETLEVFLLELLRRANTYRDLQAWTAFQQSLEETVLAWFHAHPRSEAACRLKSERLFIALAFERFWLTVVQSQVACESLSEMLVYLRVSLNGAILETLRVSSRSTKVSECISGERDLERHLDDLEVWNWIQAKLSNVRERRPAYLLYHCGLDPAEIETT